MSSKNRSKGHRLERETVNLYKETGSLYAKTSREASRLYDNCGIDIWGARDLCQCKDVLAAINYTVLFDEIDKLVEENFPEESVEHNMPRVIRHIRRRKKVKTKNEDLIIIPTVYYFNLLKELKELKELKK